MQSLPSRRSIPSPAVPANVSPHCCWAGTSSISRGGGTCPAEPHLQSPLYVSLARTFSHTSSRRWHFVALPPTTERDSTRHALPSATPAGHVTYRPCATKPNREQNQQVEMKCNSKFRPRSITAGAVYNKFLAGGRAHITKDHTPSPPPIFRVSTTADPCSERYPFQRRRVSFLPQSTRKSSDELFSLCSGKARPCVAQFTHPLQDATLQGTPRRLRYTVLHNAHDMRFARTQEDPAPRQLLSGSVKCKESSHDMAENRGSETKQRPIFPSQSHESTITARPCVAMYSHILPLLYSTNTVQLRASTEYAR